MNTLANYAVSIINTKGRKYDEKDNHHRNPFQRDRDRIVHCSAFRRLEYKTQVFVNHEGDMFRNRLTHSIEVSQIGRTIARCLSLNEDLVEAICLAHDLGHTPFGHAGQDELNACMKDYGGFEHNLQSLRVVDLLEDKYADFIGLNLGFETREGILKHCSRKNAEQLGEVGQRFILNKKPSLEAQIANIADTIAYNNHDIDDGIRAGLLHDNGLKECELYKDCTEEVKQKYGELDSTIYRNEVIRRMINSLVIDLLECSQANITSLQIETLADVHDKKQELIGMSEGMQQKNLQLKTYLRKNMYQHEKVVEMTDHAKTVIRKLFNAFMDDETLIPEDFKNKRAYKDLDNNENSKARVVADYIAGMTDRYAIAENKKLA